MQCHQQRITTNDCVWVCVCICENIGAAFHVLVVRLWDGGMKEAVAPWLSAVIVLTAYTLIRLRTAERWVSKVWPKGQVIVMEGSKIKPLIWQDQSYWVTWSSRVCVCVCVHVRRLGSVSVAPPSPRSCYIYPQAPTYELCSQVIPLQSCPPRKSCLLRMHTLHILLQWHAILRLAPSHLYNAEAL